MAVAACYLSDANAVGEIFNVGRAVLLWEGLALPISLLLVMREALVQGREHSEYFSRGRSCTGIFSSTSIHYVSEVFRDASR